MSVPVLRPCSNGCGWTAFENRSTCCRSCSGPQGPHSSDCSTKNCLIVAPADVEVSAVAEAPDTVPGVAPQPISRAQLSTNRPYFVVVHSLIVLVLWLGFALKEYGSTQLFSADASAGLETLFPDGTLLVAHRDCEDLRPQIYRWWTYQYTHSNVWHVGSNVLFCLWIGIPLGRFQNSLRMFCIFYTGVFGGAMGFLLGNAHSAGVMGMSGGVYALLTFRFADLIMNWRETKRRFVILGVLLLTLIVDIVMFYVALSKEGEVLSTSYSAHLGGAIAGLLLGIPMSRNARFTWWGKEFWLRVACLGVGLFVVAFCINWTRVWPPRTVWDTAPYCWARQVRNKTLFGDGAWHCIRCADDDANACISSWSEQTDLLKVNAEICSYEVGWEN